MTKKSLIFLFIFSLLFISCQTVQKNETVIENTIYESKDYLHKITSKTYYIAEHNTSCTIISIDLDIPGLELIIKPSSPENKQFPLYSLDSFSREFNSIVSINTTPFYTRKNYFAPLGITKIDNNIITPAEEKYSAIAFYTNKNKKLRSVILKSQKDEEIQKYPFVIGGYFKLLENNQLTFDKNITRRSRSAIGVSKDGRFLYLLCAVPVNSLLDNNGLTFNECAQELQNAGSYNVLLLDGGHSSSIAVKDRIIQKPIGQKKVPSVLGFSIN